MTLSPKLLNPGSLEREHDWCIRICLEDLLKKVSKSFPVRDGSHGEIASPENAMKNVSSAENAKKNAKLKLQVVGRGCLDLVLTLS